MKSAVISVLTFFLLLGCQTDSSDSPDKSSEQTACRKDAKICPDGQTVTRNPDLNCDFNPCPEPASEVECMGDMKQCPDGSFVIRDPQQDCHFKACPDPDQQKEPTMYCTQDVAQCADGSYVGRDPNNNCEFKPCPDGSQPERSKTRID